MKDKSLNRKKDKKNTEFQLGEKVSLVKNSNIYLIDLQKGRDIGAKNTNSRFKWDFYRFLENTNLYNQDV